MSLWATDALPRLLACIDSFPRVLCFTESALVVLLNAVQGNPWRAHFLLAPNLLPVLVQCLVNNLMKPLVQVGCGDPC